nr:fibronectin type III domain-containing protein [uncultured Arsenicibacter sp.]
MYSYTLLSRKTGLSLLLLFLSPAIMAQATSLVKYPLSEVLPDDSCLHQPLQSVSVGVDSTVFNVEVPQPVTIACPIPTGQSEILTGSRAQLTWTFVSGSTGYNLQWRTIGASAWTTVANVCCSQYLLTNLITGQAYEWQLQTICSDGSTSAYTSPRTFTASCGTPSSCYTNYVTSTSAKLYWTTSLSGVTFAIRYRPRTTPEAAWTLITGLTGSPYNLTGLVNGQSYEWQIQTLCSADASSPFSQTASFTTNCNTPYFYSSFLSADRVSLSWSDYGYGARYTLIYKPVSSPISTTISNLTTTTYSLTGLTAGIAYRAQLQLVCSDGNVSDLSSPISFTPSCNAPGYFQFNTKATYVLSNWQTFGTGISYEIQYRPQGTTTWFPSLTATSSPFTISNLVPETLYEARVRTLCTNGNQSTWISANFTTTGCFYPFERFEYEYGGGNIDLTWSHWDERNRYMLRWRPIGQPLWNNVLVNDDHYWLIGLPTGTSYEWQLQSKCSDTFSSDFSPIRTFTTSCNYPSTRGESYITETSAEVFWITQMGIRYQVRWRPVATSTWNTSQTITYGYNYGYGYYTLSNSLVSGQTYEWQIQSFCSDGKPSGYSPSRTFTTQCSYPLLIDFKYITTNAIGLTWGGPTSGLTYQLRWRVTDSTSWIGNAISQTNTYSLTGLSASTTYDIQIRPLCSTTDWSVIKTLSTPSSCGFLNLSRMMSSLNAQQITIDWGDQTIGDTIVFSLQPLNSTTTNNTYVISTNPYTLTGLSPNTAYLLNYSISCKDNGESKHNSHFYFITPPLPPCPAMYTIADGDWTDPTTWSCNRLPTSNDIVEIRHAVTIPANQTGKAQQVNYTTGGRIVSGTGAILLIGL